LWGVVKFTKFKMLLFAGGIVSTANATVETAAPGTTGVVGLLASATLNVPVAPVVRTSHTTYELTPVAAVIEPRALANEIGIPGTSRFVGPLAMVRVDPLAAEATVPVKIV
jgi:hypothetical protein